MFITPWASYCLLLHNQQKSMGAGKQFLKFLVFWNVSVGLSRVYCPDISTVHETNLIKRPISVVAIILYCFLSFFSIFIQLDSIHSLFCILSWKILCSLFLQQTLIFFWEIRATEWSTVASVLISSSVQLMVTEMAIVWQRYSLWARSVLVRTIPSSGIGHGKDTWRMILTCGKWWVLRQIVLVLSEQNTPGKQGRLNKAAWLQSV